MTDSAHSLKPFELVLYEFDPKKKTRRRRRSYFADEKTALQKWKEFKRREKHYGVMAGSLTLKNAASLDRSIRRLGDKGTIDQAVDFYLQHNGTAGSAPLLGQAIADHLALKEKLNRSPVHVSDLKWRLGLLTKKFGAGSPVQAIMPNSLLDLLLSVGGSARSVRNHAVAFHNFFAYYTRRRLIPLNPMAAVSADDLPTVKPKRKAILTTEQVTALLACMQERFPQHRTYYALQSFAGMRDSQAARIRREFIRHAERRIVVPAEICKTDDDWVLQDLPAVLWTWLALDKEAAAGPVLAPSEYHWEFLRDALKTIRPEDGQIPQWPWNALRRTFCTNHISLHGDAAATAALLQHQSPARLYQSYLAALRTKAEAEASFSLTPESVTGLWPQLLSRAQ